MKSFEVEVGQLYLHERNNQYMIVTANKNGTLTYAGLKGLTGRCDYEVFLEMYPSVDPTDVNHDELEALLDLLPENSPRVAKTGVVDMDDEYAE